MIDLLFHSFACAKSGHFLCVNTTFDGKLLFFFFYNLLIMNLPFLRNHHQALFINTFTQNNFKHHKISQIYSLALLRLVRDVLIMMYIN